MIQDLRHLKMERGITEAKMPPRYNPDFVFPDKFESLSSSAEFHRFRDDGRGCSRNSKDASLRIESTQVGLHVSGIGRGVC